MNAIERSDLVRKKEKWPYIIHLINIARLVKNSRLTQIE
jgi:hypothetical protein